MKRRQTLAEKSRARHEAIMQKYREDSAKRRQADIEQRRQGREEFLQRERQMHLARLGAIIFAGGKLSVGEAIDKAQKIIRMAEALA